MIKVSDKFYSFLALLFVALTVFGYQIATSLFLPIMADSSSISRTVTYPYRAIMLLLAGMLIIFRPDNVVRNNNRKAALFFGGFFIIYCIRIFIDIFLFNVYVAPGFRETTISFILFSTLPSLWAAIRCAQYIDYDSLNGWFLYCSIAVLIIMVLNQNTLIQFEFNELTRMEANVAMNSISLGHMGVTLFFVFFTCFITKENGPINKVLLIILMVLSFIIMLRAASRGPLVAFVSLFFLVIYSSLKNKILAIVVSLALLAVIWINLDSLLAFIGSISPMMEQRVSAAAFDGDDSGRSFLYANAIDIFMRNPLFGGKFVLDNGFYSHNSILDVLMGLGLFGGIAWLYLMYKDTAVSSRQIQNRSSMMIVCILSVQMLIRCMFSGAIYTNNELIVLMTIVLSHTQKKIAYN